jgi:hypothetical protein
VNVELRITLWFLGRGPLILWRSNFGRLIERQLPSGGGWLKSKPTGKTQ